MLEQHTSFLPCEAVLELTSLKTFCLQVVKFSRTGEVDVQQMSFVHSEPMLECTSIKKFHLQVVNFPELNYCGELPGLMT